MKHCTKCGTDKPLTDYWKNNTRKDGYENMCKPCRRGADARTNHQTKNPASDR